MARLNDLTDEELAVLEGSFSSMNQVEITYSQTGHGTKLLIAREIGDDTDFVDILTIYNGYFIEFNMTPNPNAANQTLSNEQISMCVDFLTDDKVKTCLNGIQSGHRLHLMEIRNGIDFVDDGGILRRRNLRAVFPVNLIAVILGRVVACGNDNAGDAAELAKREGKLGSRTKRLETVGLNAVGGKTKRGFLAEFHGHSSRIVSNCDTFLGTALLQNEVGKTLCGLPNGIQIHPVRACADNAAKAARAEFEALVKALTNLFVVILDGEQLRFRFRIEIIIRAPETIHFLIIHSKYLLIILIRSLL